MAIPVLNLQHFSDGRVMCLSRSASRSGPQSGASHFSHCTCLLIYLTSFFFCMAHLPKKCRVDLRILSWLEVSMENYSPQGKDFEVVTNKCGSSIFYLQQFKNTVVKAISTYCRRELLIFHIKVLF